MLDDPSMLKRLKEQLFGSMGGMSMLRPVGTGIATENKLLSSRECWFHVIEWYPYDQNELKSDTEEIRDSGVDAKGEAYEVSVKFGKSIKATWLPQGGNRVSAPDIRRSEKAEIFRLGDSDKYYWRPIELGQGVRRLETAVYMFSNTQDESVTDLSPENSWVMEISTHQKTFSLITPKSDGEQFGYTFQLDTKASTFALQDDDGQEFQLDSKERKWRIANKDGSEVLVDKANVTWTVPEKFLVKCKDYEVQASNSIKETSKTHSVKTETYDLNTQTYNNTSKTYKVSTGTWNVSFNTGTGSGNINFNGRLTNNGVNVGSTHVHPGVRSGDSTTATPQ
jgi:hypothetical protein